MKGQLFILAAIILVVLLVAIKTSLNIVPILDRKNALESSLEQLDFQNLRAEILRVSDISFNQSNTSQTTNSFINFAKQVLAARTVDFQGLAVETSYANATASQDTRFNVTVFNFFNNPIDTLILNFTYDTSKNQTIRNIGSLNSNTTNFTFNTALSTDYTLWIFYNFSTETNAQNLTVKVELGKSKQTNFYNLRFGSYRGSLNDIVNQSFFLS